MCGINLFIDKKKISNDTIIRKMNHATQHRGPDAGKFTLIDQVNCSIFLGNNRLKIIDTSDEANQPFVSSDGRYYLSYSGEIYNYNELQRPLLSKYAFRTDSDTEVLLYHIIENGIEGIRNLIGMFAFIFIDKLTGKIIIVRDAQGIKPVYYYQKENYIIASSEIKGILASGVVPKELNDKQIPHYLKYKYAKRPETFYKNIFELEPGHLIEIKDNSFELKKWSEDIYTSVEPNLNLSKKKKEIKKILFNVVERQLHSDVSLGIFLSGGIDSTLLLAISHEFKGSGLPTFSICNSKKDKNFGTEDYFFAKKAANLYHSEFNEIPIDSSILKHTEFLCKQIDQPIGDSAILLTWLLSDNASQKVKVALSGAGADEWFAGYNRHQAFHNYLKYFHNKNSIIKFIKHTNNILPSGFSHPLRKQARLWNIFASNISNSPEETYNNFISQQYYENIMPDKSSSLKINTLNDALRMDREQYLISDILMLTDKMSMLKSLEVRVPYLDNELISCIAKLPEEYLLRNGRKWILKEILCELGGQLFTTRKKEGFGMPIGKWIKEKQNSYLIDNLLQENNILFRYIEYLKTKNIVREHLTNKKDNSSIIWSLIVLSTWLQIEFK